MNRVGSRVCAAHSLARALATYVACTLPAAAIAHAPGPQGDWWTQWNFTPFVTVATALSLVVYVRGAMRAGPWRRAGFATGIALAFIALQSPLDALAESAFAFHQLQHLVLLSVAPMLLALSAPATPLLAGLPDWALRRLYQPVAATAVARNGFRLLSTPPVAASHFAAVMLFWLLPPVQEQALLDRATHDLMHFSMLAAGLFFWFCAFDSRPPPNGARYGARAFMLLAALLVNIPLGAFLSYKENVLFSAYGSQARAGLPPLDDERVGGLIQYVPGSMMFVLGVLLVLAAWHRHEQRLDARRARGLPQRAAASEWTARMRNRRNLRLGITLAGVCILMFVAAIASGLLATGAPD